jgi:hypothetical protein
MRSVCVDMLAQDAVVRATSRFAWLFFVSFYILGIALLWNLIASYLIEAYQVRPCAAAGQR